MLAALVDHKLKELDFKLAMTHEVEFIGYNHPDGRRTYLRSLCFVLQNAVRELFPDKVLVIDHSLPSGLYCKVIETRKQEDGRCRTLALTQEQLASVKRRMQEIVSADMPFRKEKIDAVTAEKMFEENNQPEKLSSRSLSASSYAVCISLTDMQIPSMDRYSLRPVI